MRKSGTPTYSRYRGRKRPSGRSIQGAHDPLEDRSCSNCRSPAQEDDVLIVGIHFDHVVIPALMLADVGRPCPRPCCSPVCCYPDTQIRGRATCAIGNRRIHGACIEDSQIDSTHRPCSRLGGGWTKSDVAALLRGAAVRGYGLVDPIWRCASVASRAPDCCIGGCRVCKSNK